MSLPSIFLASLSGTPGFNQPDFEQVHLSGEQVTSVRVNPEKGSGANHTIAGVRASPVPWSRYGYYLDERPSFTFDPLFHAGTYYVQEASSMFLEQAFLQLTSQTEPLKVLDLCAAPGGKSTHLLSLLPANSLLVSNEVIRQRAAVLKENIIKWGAENAVVTNNDPKDFARLAGFFDVLVVDAPCSGSGLFRRDPEAINEWSLNNVALCAQRQQRILADVWPALQEGGLLIYSTCSYSAEEDEQIMDWLQQELGGENCSLSVDPAWGILETVSDGGNRGYRFWPDRLKGEGFFLACFRKISGGDSTQVKPRKLPDAASKSDREMTGKWMNITGKTLIRYQQTVYAWPSDLYNEFAWLLEQTKLLYSGIKAGELMRDKLVPDHALAMSVQVSSGIRRVELDPGMAIRYLQRKDLHVEAVPNGWVLACFQGKALGWMNVLPGRVNNYYPKELRILKDI